MSNSKNTTGATVKRIYAQKNAEARVLERRERLLNAGLELFATLGYAHSTIEALCSTAKVTTRHFYQIFPSREALLMALYNQITDELNAVLLAAIQADHATFPEKMQHVVEALVTHYLSDTRRARVGVLEVVGASPVIEQRRREVIHDIAGHLQHFLQSTTPQPQTTPHHYHWLAIAVVGGLNEVMAEWLMQPQLSLEQLTQEILLIAHTLLRGIAEADPVLD